jgi:hypothetical protein
MRTERVGTVAVMSTDPRDKLFLVRQLAHAAPNVALMTVESDSIYYHPDYAYYMQGTIVASTYPLYSGSQRWTEGADTGAERHVFANGSSEGMYNAALLLLNYKTNGEAFDKESAPRLIDYSMPGEPCASNCKPPVWISVVGSNGAWPVRASISLTDVHGGVHRNDAVRRGDLPGPAAPQRAVGDATGGRQAHSFG